MAKSCSFDMLAAMFGIEYSVAKSIFWAVCRATLDSEITIPNLLDDNFDMNVFYAQIYNSLDPFFQTLYGAFKDPTGRNIFFLTVLYLLILL